MGILDKLKAWLTPKPPEPKPPPDVKPAPPKPERKNPGVTDYIRVWQLLNGAQLKNVWPALVTVPVIAFFALSGLVAWLVLFGGLILRFFSIGLGV